MNDSASQLRQSIASNKFYPPHINQSQLLERYAIIADRLTVAERTKKIVLIEAQAGQGKTTLIYQYLVCCNHPFIWYQVGSEDSDPVILLSALQLALSKSIEGFTSDQLTAILENGQIGPMDLRRCANILLHDADAQLQGDTFIVFDDLHLIGNSELTNTLLDHIIDTSPPQLHFIFTSRHPFKLKAQQIKKNPHLLFLDTKDLALDLTEIEDFYNTVLGKSITRSEAQEILEVTNGWVMGIVLAAHPYAKGSIKHPRKLSGHEIKRLLAEGNDGYILTFFKDEIFSHIPDELHNSLLRLAFLDEIDIRLARIVVDEDNIDRHLDRMANENYFVYHLDLENHTFRFHHLFQEFLQIMGRQTLGSEEVSQIYLDAAEYYLENDLPEKALKALRSAENYPQMETILKRHGPQLISANRTVTILDILRSIPEETLREYSWLSLFYGVLSTDFTPRQTLPYFESCRNQFLIDGEEAGELMSLSQIIYYHFVISGQYHSGSRLLERTRTLFERNHLLLPDEITIIVARNLAAGYCFFDGNMQQARHYAQLSCNLAISLGSNNFTAATRFILGYIGLLSGNPHTARNEIEQSHALANDPLVGMSNRLTLHIMQLCHLSMHGEFASFQHHKQLIQASINQLVVQQTIAAPYLFIWPGIELLAAGREGEAIEIFEKGMFVSKTALSEHMTSQFLQWHAYASALIGNKEQALKNSETSASLRAESGGLFYVAFNLAIRGATLLALGNFDQARTTLEEGVRMSESIPSPYIKVCCLAYLALVDGAEEKIDSAAGRIQEWIALMKANNYKYFWGWEPKSISSLLCLAVRLGIETDFAQTCAREQLGIVISPQGVPLPMLAVRVLGEFSIGIGTILYMGPQDLSAAHRELIGLLLSSPGQRLSREQVQLVFWPDSPPEKARTAYDTLMTRLRKALEKKLPEPATNYISVGKGYVQLTNVSIDAVQFMHAARSGLSFCKQDFWWQAENAFAKALSCWNSLQLNEIFTTDQALDFYDQIQNTMRDMCLTWSLRLARQYRYDEALAILDKTNKILSVEEDCIALRYQLYLKKNSPLKARDVLTNYRQELLRLGYSNQEADELITSLAEQNSPL